MCHKKLLKALSLLPVLLFLWLVSPLLFTSFGVMCIGGVITQGILGGFSGKVGPIVGGKWKETNYMRSHVIPANPQSVAQTAQRDLMSAMVAKAKLLLSTLIQPYWNPFYSSVSGYNEFVKQNIKLLGADPFPWTVSNKFSIGSLTGVAGVTTTYNTATGEVIYTWTDNTGQGNALGTDIAVTGIMKLDGTTVYDVGFDTAARSEGSRSVTIATGLTATDLISFLFFKRGTGSSLIVSNSSQDVCAAP